MLQQSLISLDEILLFTAALGMSHLLEQHNTTPSGLMVRALWEIEIIKTSWAVLGNDIFFLIS